MNSELFEQLLYEEETATLDFKSAQYPFAKATDNEKSELLKDILGFANAWRRSHAYILIGVEEVRGGRSNVVGIPVADHLNDHSLQQFVNSLTNQPVRFRYEALGFEGKQVGVFCIEEQARPIYLKRDYGKLKKQEVYVRRGSSTDPTKPASLEEVARMGVGQVQSAAELVVEFADVESDDSLGASVRWHTESCEMPDTESIPDWDPPRARSSFGIDLSPLPDLLNRPNIDYYRELAEYEFVRRLFRPVRLVVKNMGQVAATNVRAELTVPTNIGVIILDESEVPAEPSRRIEIVSPGIERLRSPFLTDPGEVILDRNDERFRVDIDCGDLQPGRRVRSDFVYLGKGQTGDVILRGEVFADNLPQPKEFTLTVSVTVKETRMSVDQLCQAGRHAGKD